MKKKICFIFPFNKDVIAVLFNISKMLYFFFGE